MTNAYNISTLYKNALDITPGKHGTLTEFFNTTNMKKNCITNEHLPVQTKLS